MKTTKKSRTLLNRMILHSMDSHDAFGLFYGQMGVILTIAQCAKQWAAPELDCSADFLFKHISNNVNNVSSLTFGSGLAGICWGIEYLVYHGIMPGPAHDICVEADARIMDLDIRRIKDFGLEDGALGLWHYVQSRIQGNAMARLLLPFDNVYLQDWRSLIDNHHDDFPANAQSWLESALNGHIEQQINLSLADVIDAQNVTPDDNLSLHNGLAGFIALNYLEHL